MDDLTQLEDLVGRYFEDAPPTLFHSKVLKEVTVRMVKHSDGQAADQIFKYVYLFYIEGRVFYKFYNCRYYSDKAVEHLMQTMPSLENIQDEIENFRRRYKADDFLNALNSLDTKTRAKRRAVSRSAVPIDTPTTSNGPAVTKAKRLKTVN